MIIVDANVLLYAVNESAPHHVRARRWMEAALNGDEPVAFSWVALLAFVRISTLRALSPEPLGPAQALGFVDDWLAAAAATVVHPTSRHAAVLRGFLEQAGTAGNLVTDAHLAALSIEHGARICTFDRDLDRFSGVRMLTPS